MSTTTAPMTNRYAGTCVNCRQRVAAGAGTATKTASGWAVQHTDCSSQVAATMGTGWSNASIRRRGGSVYGARAGAHGSCADCGANSDLVRGLCTNCRYEY